MLKLELSTIYDTFYKECKTSDEACAFTLDFIKELDLVFGSFERAELFDETGKYLGWISYQGHFWSKRGTGNE